MKFWIVAVAGFSLWLSMQLSFSVTSKWFLQLSSSLSSCYYHGSKPPECNRNRALSGIICFSFLSGQFFSLPSRFDHIWMFGCALLLCRVVLWMNPLKVIRSLCLLRLRTRSSHILAPSLVVKTWKLLTVERVLPFLPPLFTTPPFSLLESPWRQEKKKLKQSELERFWEKERDIDKRKKSLDMCWMDTGKIIPLYLHTTVTVMTLACSHQ